MMQSSPHTAMALSFGAHPDCVSAADANTSLAVSRTLTMLILSVTTSVLT